MKTCPISNQPIDFLTHENGAYQVTCPQSGWMTGIIEDLDEAIQFRATVDVFKLAKGAKREERDGKVRLVNGIWMTKYMSRQDMEAFFPAPKKP